MGCVEKRYNLGFLHIVYGLSDILLGCLFGSYVGYNVVDDDSCKTPVNEIVTWIGVG